MHKRNQSMGTSCQSSSIGQRVPSVHSTLGRRLDQLNLNNIDQLSDGKLSVSKLSVGKQSVGSTKQLCFTPKNNIENFNSLRQDDLIS